MNRHLHLQAGGATAAGAGRQSRPGGGGARTPHARDAQVRRRAGAHGGCCAGVHGALAARWRGGRGRRPTVGTAPPAPGELQADASPVNELIWHAIGACGGLVGMRVGLSCGTVRARELGARCGGRIRTSAHPLAGHARSPRVPDIRARMVQLKLRRRRRVPRLGPQPESHGPNRTERRDRFSDGIRKPGATTRRRPSSAPGEAPGPVDVFAPALKRWAEWGLGCQTRRNNALNIFSHYQPTQD